MDWWEELDLLSHLLEVDNLLLISHILVEIHRLLHLCLEAAGKYFISLVSIRIDFQLSDTRSFIK